MGIFDWLLNHAEEDGDDRHFEEMGPDLTSAPLRPVKTRSERSFEAEVVIFGAPLSKGGRSSYSAGEFGEDR